MAPNATFPSQERLVRKEVALGYIRELQYPLTHIGLSIAPFLPVDSDDAVFQYVQDNATGMAPARAEDAESELASKEETFGIGRASIIDWSIKDHYQTSDVTRYNEAIYLNGQLPQGSFPLTVTQYKDSFEKRVARDTLLRKAKLDNRIEWMIMQALWRNNISYNSNKVKFSVDYNRPSNQSAVSVTPWNTSASDPIDNIMAVQEFMLKTNNFFMSRAITSRQVIRGILASSKFAARAGIAGSTQVPVDPRYVIDGWGYQAALDVIERSTGIKFEMYDTVFRTRAAGATTLTNHRFSPHDQVLFLPSEQDIAAFAVDDIGFGKVLTSPHPAGNWTSGYYEWEKDQGQDPWGYDVGTGIKAFPVFPHLDKTYSLKVL